MKFRSEEDICRRLWTSSDLGKIGLKQNITSLYNLALFYCYF